MDLVQCVGEHKENCHLTQWSVSASFSSLFWFYSPQLYCFACSKESSDKPTVYYLPSSLSSVGCVNKQLFAHVNLKGPLQLVSAKVGEKKSVITGICGTN